MYNQIEQLNKEAKTSSMQSKMSGRLSGSILNQIRGSNISATSMRSISWQDNSQRRLSIG